MKNLMFLFLLTFSQFAFSQTGDDVNIIYIDCEIGFEAAICIAIFFPMFSNLF